MRLQLSITTKLTLVFLLFATVLLVGVGMLAYNRGRTALEAATISDLLSTAIEKEAALNTWIEDRQSDIATLTTSPDLLEDMATFAAAPRSAAARAAHDHLVRTLQTWVGSEQQYLSLLVIEAETGQVIAATDPGEEGKFKEDRPFFTRGKTGPYVQNIYYSPESEEPEMAAAAPLRSPEGQVLAVLAGQLNLAEMNTIINRRTELHQTDEAFLVDTSNLFVTQPRFITDPAVLRQGIHTEAIKSCLAGNSGVISAGDYRGVPVIAVYRWLSEQQLCLIVKLEQAEAFAPAHSFGQTLLSLGGLGLLAASVLAVGLARTITRPVLALQAGVTRFGRGELDLRLPDTSGDELGRLGREFNLMALTLAEKEAQLRSYTEELEQRVQERTVALGHSEALLRQILDTNPNIIFVKDRQANVILANQALADSYQMSLDELVGRSQIEFHTQTGMNQEELQQWLADDRAVIDTGRPKIILEPYTHRDGGRHWNQTKKFPLDLPDGSRGVLVISEDITQRKQAEEQFRLVVEASPNAIILVSPDGQINLVNTRAETLFGYGREELIGQPVEKLVPPQFHSHHHHDRRAFFSAPTDRPMGAGRDLFGLRKDGSQVPVEIGLTLITTLEGIFVLATVIDITERKQAEEALRESEQRYSAIFDKSPFAIALTKMPERAAVGVNDAFLKLFEYAWEEVVGKTSVDLRISDPDSQAQIAAELQARGSVRDLECTRITKSGARLVLSLNLDWVDIGGEKYVLTTIRDITDRKRAEEALRLSEERFAKAFWASPQAVAISRLADGRLIEVNDSWQDLFEYSRREVVGQSVLALNIFVDPADHPRVLAQMQKQGFVRDFELKIQRKSGEVRQISLSAEMIEIDNESCLLSIITDITERKRAEEALQKAYHELETANHNLKAINQELESFSYSVSHDLRAPLRSIDGFSQALAEDYADKLDAEGQDYLRRVRAASQHMAQLIDDLLALSRVTRSEMQPQLVNLSTLAQTIAAELRKLEPERQVEFVVAKEVMARADERLIRVALENLLANAWKFTAKQPSAQIEFGLVRQDGRPVYFVRDDGAGFDMTYVNKLFGAFQRLHSPVEFPGTGVGLATVQRIIHRHGGRIWAEGAVKQGATFYFTLQADHFERKDSHERKGRFADGRQS